MTVSHSNLIAKSSDSQANANVSSRVIALLVGVLCFGFGVYWLSAIGAGATAFFGARLILDAGEDLPIESFMLVLASFQWIIGPIMAYEGFSDHYKYFMYVPEDEYMALAVPGVLMFSLGLYSFRSRKRISYIDHFYSITRQIVNRSDYLPFYLIGIGLIFSYFASRFPPSLAFPVYILSNVKYIGLIYLIFSDRHVNKTPILIFAFSVAFMSSLKAAMFHDLILWCAFIGMYALYIFKPSATKKVFYLCLGLAFIFIVQTAKEAYREKLKYQGHSNLVSKFVSSFNEELTDNSLSESDNVEKLVVRINQGWIISKIMQRVPETEPHAEGETIKTALKASILPRLLFPDKPIAGGKANYQKYTGFWLTSSTSMGISLLGEAYINFGVKGAWLFMFVFGVFSSFVIHRVFLLALRFPTIWLWFPLIMLHFVKTETELLVQLNFLVKSIVLVYAIVWANKYILKLRM